MQTPAYQHTTVLLNEAVEALNIRPGGVYVDATFGGGGHTRLILSMLDGEGKLFAFDQDEDAWVNEPQDSRFVLIKENFRHLKRFLRFHGVPKVDGILADLGVSSHQFDTADRGFSTRFEGPLDMRMDTRAPLTAAKVLETYPEAELQRIFEEYGEVRNARQLARLIAEVRKRHKLATIAGLQTLIAPAVKGIPAKYLAQVFQALRIEVNQELEVLREFLQQAPDCLNPGGRLSVISFHSLEDRLVKHCIRDNASLEAVTSKPLIPTDKEIKQNPRSRSAKLRVAEKIAD